MRERCPFLEGLIYQKRFEGVSKANLTVSRKINFDFSCPLTATLFNSQADHLEKRGCLNGTYSERCPDYACRKLELELKIPLHCPLKSWSENKEICSLNQDSCDVYWIDIQDREQDYRTCSDFSKWFWETQAKFRKAERVESAVKTAICER